MFAVYGLLNCGSSATVRLELQNQTDTTTATSQLSPRDFGSGLGKPTASRFAMRLAMVYLSEDVNALHDNVGNVSRIWESPHCDGEADCDYFDFAQGSTAVNAALNARAASVQPGTYRYVRLEFCRGTPAHSNVEWQAAGMDAPHGWISGTCAIDSVRLDPPLVLGAADNVSVSLGYSMDGTTMTGTTNPNYTGELHALYDKSGKMFSFDDCVRSTDTSATCFRMPTFTPSVK